jgi:hypothetical protein
MQNFALKFDVFRKKYFFQTSPSDSVIVAIIVCIYSICMYVYAVVCRLPIAC